MSLITNQPSNLVVQKYGGSSLRSPKHIRNAAGRIAAARKEGKELVVVVSAMGYTTDHLLKIARRTVSKPPEREVDMLLTAGERISMSLLAMALHELGIPAISFTGSQSGIVTDGEHTQAKILDIRGHRILEELAKGKVVIIAGFQGVSEAKEITTLGRGGSDTTAVALAAKLKASACEIFTDVDGLFTADPKVVEDARLIANCSYDEALELASLGAKMQPRSLEVARKFQVKVRISSSTNAKSTGTLIESAPTGGNVERSHIRGIASKDDMAFVQTSAPLKEALAVLKSQRAHSRFFSSNGQSTSLVVDGEKIQGLCDQLKAAGHSISSVNQVSVVSMVGEGLLSESDVLPELFEALDSAGIEALWVGVNALSISAAVASSKKQQAARVLHERFIPEKQKPTP